MRRLESLWPAIEEVPGPAAVAAQWRELLGGDYDLARPYLRPGAELAMSYPRPGPGWQGVPYPITEHAPEDCVAICPETGETIPLSRSDRIIYELDFPLLTRCLAEALGVEHRYLPPEGLHPAAHLVGAYRPLAGYSFPVYLTIPLESRILSRTVCALAAVEYQSFIILAPTDRRLRPDIRTILEGRKAYFLSLSEALALDDSGRMVATDVAARALRAFSEAHIPSAEAPGGREVFPTPAGAVWAELSIRFLDGHRVSAKVRDVSRVLSYDQMGMADRRNGNPTAQWELLCRFARERGTLTWQSRGADRKNQKRKENLARDLKRFFRIEGDPIELTPDGDGWRTAFALEPDA